MNWLQQASTSAAKSDAVFFFVFGLSVFFLLFITGLMIYFVLRYSQKRHPKAEQIEGNTGLEIVWTLVPLAIFYYGWTNFEYMRLAPSDSMVVKVTAKQWNWSFEYPNGKQTKVLFAPLNRPMKLEVRSVDMVHGFYVPSFRLKIDAVPSRANTTWFQATQLGSFDIECTVICGVDHSLMLSKVVVVPEEEFKTWYFGGEDAPEPGQALRAAVAHPTLSNEPTVYFFFKSKEGILNELIRSLFGSEYESLLERYRSLSDPIAALKMAAPISRTIYDAVRSEMAFILGIYALSPKIWKVVSSLEQQRYERQEPTIRLLESHNLLPNHLDVSRARDLLWMLTCRDNYRLLVIDRGWSSEEYEDWLSGALVQSLVRS